MDSFKGEFFIRTVNPPSDVLFKGEFIRTANPPCHILRGQIPSKDPGKVLFHCRSTLVGELQRIVATARGCCYLILTFDKKFIWNIGTVKVPI